MKNIIKILLLVLVSISFISCNEAEELLDIKFNSQLSADLNVAVPGEALKSAEMLVINFSEQTTIDPRSDSQINKYINKLKSFDVYEVTGTVINVSAPVEIITGSITFTDGLGIASWSVTNFNVVNSATITLDNSAGQWDKINQFLDSKNEFTVKIEGTTDRGNVNFTIRVLIKVKVVANPL